MNVKKLLIYFIAVAVTVSMTPVFGNTGTADAATAVAAPGAVKAAARTTSSIKVYWSKVSGVTGYALYRSEGKGYKKIKTLKKASYINKKLKKNKTYKYKVKAYKKSAGKNVYGKYTYTVSSKPKPTSSKKTQNVKKVKVSKSSVLLQKGKTVTVKASITPSKKVVSKKVYWTSTNSGVAVVSSKGVITAKGIGNCTVYARAHNGQKAKISVKVISDSYAAKDIYNMTQKSDAALKYADQIGNTLAYDSEYFDEDSGFRTAGSDAEHRASKYLASQFKSIGLTDVSRDPVTVDKWQFNEAFLSLKYKDGDGKDKTLRIKDMVSYASDGTKQTGGDYTGIGIVDMGMGTLEDYQNYYTKSGTTDMTGKIVLVGVDQWNETWIDGPYMEAKAQNAAGLVTYSTGGYAQYNDDTLNIQDICAPNLHIPCTSISKNDAIKIQAAIKTGTDVTANYYVDNEVSDENGVSYNVTGKIEGSGNTDQQIVVAAHYDKYFYGFEDDSIAVGLVMGMAKAMKDSGYKPECDIVFVAHGSEEWGELSTSTDWAIGSWEMITEAHPEWQGKTLALINFELPAINDYNDSGVMRTSYEIGNVGKTLLDSDLLSDIDGFYKNGITVANDDEATQTDAIAYQFNGVPFMMPRQKNRTTWTQNRYHTQYDNNSETDPKGDGVYSKALLKYDLELYTAMAMYIDKTPALELDFGSRCDELEAAIDGTDKYAQGTQVSDYKQALSDLKTAAANNLKKAKAINAEYSSAYAKGDDAAMKASRDKGTALNEKNLAAFKYSQDEFIGLADYGDTEVYHKGVQNNLDMYNDTITALEDGTVTESDVWIPSEINGYYEYYAYLYSDDVCTKSYDLVQNKDVKDNWGTGKMSPAVKDAWKTTKKVYALWNGGKTASSDYATEIGEYRGYVTTLQSTLQDYLDKEINGMQTMKGML